MERYAWKATLLPGKLEEYERRHNEIWPEMKQMFREAGICNYTIWNTGDELFGYYECQNGHKLQRACRRRVRSWPAGMPT